MAEKKSNGQAKPSAQYLTAPSLPGPAFAGKIRKTYHKSEAALPVLPKPLKMYDDEAAAKIIMAGSRFAGRLPRYHQVAACWLFKS